MLSDLVPRKITSGDYISVYHSISTNFRIDDESIAFGLTCRMALSNYSYYVVFFCSNFFTNWIVDKNFRKLLEFNVIRIQQCFHLSVRHNDVLRHHDVRQNIITFHILVIPQKSRYGYH